MKYVAESGNQREVNVKKPKPRPFVIILRGLPGVGKTSTSLVLKEKLAPAAGISIDVLRSFVTPRLLIPDHLRVAKLTAAHMAAGYAEVGTSSIIDSVFEDERVLDEMQNIIEEARLTAHVFTLRANLGQTLDRNLARDRHPSSADRKNRGALRHVQVVNRS